MSGDCWVIEASESPITKPYFLHGTTGGKCFFLWSDNFNDAKKFTTVYSASEWAAKNRLNCGFRVRGYTKNP